MLDRKQYNQQVAAASFPDMSHNQMLCFYLCGCSDFKVAAFNQELRGAQLVGDLAF